MRHDSFRNRKNGGRVSTALAIQDDTRDMLRQLVLPLVAERRVKGALDYVARESGVSY